MNQGYAHEVRNDFLCVSCGYSIRGVEVDGLCPECGTPVQHSIQNRSMPTSGYAITSLVLGIFSIVTCMTYGITSMICGPLAIYFGMTAKKQIARGERNESSVGMAQAGFICGIIGACIGLIVIGFIIIAIFVSISAGRGGGLGP